MLGYYILGVHAVISLIIILLVAFQDHRSRRNQVFMAATTIFTILTIANTLSLETSLDQLFFIRMVMVSATLATFSLFLLIQSIRTNSIFKSGFSKFLTILTVITVVVDASPLLFVDYKQGVPPQPIPGPLAILFFVHFVLVVAAAVFSLRKHMSLAKGKEVEQYRSILVGLLPILILAPLTSFILPLVFHINNFIILSPLYTLFFIVCVSYAVVRHGLFDIRLAAVRSVAYTLSLLTLAVIYYVLVYFVSLAFFSDQTTSNVSVSPVNVLLALVLAFIFQPIKTFFDRVTDVIFFRGRYSPNDFYTQLSEVLASTKDLRSLLQRAAAEIGATLKSEQTTFYVAYGEGGRVVAGTKGHTNIPQSDVSDLDKYVGEQGDNIIVTNTLTGARHISKILRSHKIAILLPLTHRKEVIGYLALGEQLSSGYTSRDIRTLQTVSDELVIAIQNALSVQEVKELNAHLQQRISAATSELRRTNARLRRLDTTKDEFLSMASHQLRTPLTSIKGYLSMVLDGDLGRISATQKKVLEEAFTSSERMVHLIHDFLNVSRLQTGRFVLELDEADLSGLVKDEVDSLRRVAASRNMIIEYNDQAGPASLMLDDTKLRQVVMNYIDNAIYYSKPDTTITVELSKQNGNIVLKVQDTGIGVPPSEQSQLFEKFFRATNARKQRPDGTGVGLYLAKKVITAHGGDVLFSSKAGKGSMFGFKLPLTQNQALLEKNSTKQF